MSVPSTRDNPARKRQGSTFMTTPLRNRVTAIDPAGCRCADCQRGRTLPLDSPNLSRLPLPAIFAGGHPVPMNCTNAGTLILYTGQGKTVPHLNPELVPGSYYITILPGTDDRDSSETPIDVSAIPDQPNGERNLLITDLLRAAPMRNPTDSTFVPYRTPTGETGIVELRNCATEPLVLVPQD